MEFSCAAEPLLLLDGHIFSTYHHANVDAQAALLLPSPGRDPPLDDIRQALQDRSQQQGAVLWHHLVSVEVLDSAFSGGSSLLHIIFDYAEDGDKGPLCMQTYARTLCIV